MPEVGVFLQARMASTRFPGKVLAPFGPTTVIESAMVRLGTVPCDIRVVVTDLASLNDLSPVTARHGWEVYAGHPTDVMARYIAAAKYYNVRVVVRATGDNPLVDGPQASWLLGLHLRTVADATHPLGGTPGTAVEVVNREALETFYPLANPTYREHVMPGVYVAGRINEVWVAETWPEPVTIDTPEDLVRVEKLWREHGQET